MITSMPERLFSAGECPVCPGSGAQLFLRRAGTGLYFFYCPLCGVGWEEPTNVLDEIRDLASFAPDGWVVPEPDEVRRAHFRLVEVPASEAATWLSIMRAA